MSGTVVLWVRAVSTWVWCISEHSAYVVVLGAVVVVEVELSFASFKQEVSLLGPTVIYERGNKM